MADLSEITPKKRIIRPSSETIRSVPRSYSHAVKVGYLLCIAGQVALHADLGLIGVGNLAERARQVWKNFQIAVEAAGGKIPDVALVTAYQAEASDLDGIHAVRREFFPEEDFPTATVVQVAALVSPGFLLETDAFAHVGCSERS